MKKFLAVFLPSFIFIAAFSQTQHRLSAYLQTHYNKTICDRTKGNNPWGMGLGVQAFLDGGSKFKPTADLTADIYLEDDKVLRMTDDSETLNRVNGMINIFAGICYYPTQTAYLSFTAGPSFISGQTLLGIKPSLGIHFPQNKKWMTKVSYINIFNREKIEKEDFGSISLSLGLKIF